MSLPVFDNMFGPYEMDPGLPELHGPGIIINSGFCLGAIEFLQSCRLLGCSSSHNEASLLRVVSSAKNAGGTSQGARS